MTIEKQNDTLELIQKEVMISATLIVIDGRVAVVFNGKTYETEYHIYQLSKMIEDNIFTPKQIAITLLGIASQMQVNQFAKENRDKDRITHYVISILALVDATGKEKEEWRYAGFDRGGYGSGDACWCYSERDCEKFRDPLMAKQWFEQYKHFLFGQYYSPRNFNISTLAIRKVVHIVEEKLSI